MKKNNRINRCLCIIFTLLFALPLTVFGKTISQIEAEQAELAKEKAAIEEKLEGLREEEADAQEYQDALQESIDITKERIDIANATIIELNSSIAELQASLDAAAEEYEDTLNALKERIKAVYKAGETNTLEILLNSTSLYDFSMRTNALEVIAEYDQQLMDDINVYIDKTKIDREALTKQKEQLAEIKIQLETDQQELEVLMDENAAVLAELQNLSAEALSAIEDIEAENAELQDEIEALIAEEERLQAEAEAAAGNGSTQLPDNGSNSSFDAAWPVPGFGTNWITSYWGDGRNHKGLDIAAYYGTPIVASEGGKVLEVRYSSGWGNSVLVYHNGTYSTRYAHMSSFAVSVGDYVTKNQVLGYVGSTGNSSGNHLHYEIYKNGTRVDPYPYL